MRAIQVRGLIAPQAGSVLERHRHHVLYLGNGRTLRFNSLREARQHQADVNRFLNEQLHELNYLLGRAHVDYRTAWPLFFADGHQLMPGVERRVREGLQVVAVALDNSVNRNSSPNGMHFAWKFLTDAARTLADVFTALGEVYRYKTQGVLRHHVLQGARLAEAVGQRLRDHGG